MRKFYQLALTLGLLAIGLQVTMAQTANESVYTPLDSKSCKTLEFNEQGAYALQRCAGVGGYKLNVTEGDLRQTIDVLRPNGKKHALDFQGNVSGGFSSLGQKAEWRVQRKGKQVTPKALIVRFNVSEDPEDSSKITSYLVVTKITQSAICITDVVKPGPTANADAQKLADEAASKSCLKTEAHAAGEGDASDAESIRKVDFTNFTFANLGGAKVTMEDGLQAGACEEKDAEGIPTGTIWNVSADSIAYGDVDGDGAEEAIIPLVANVCGGNMITDDAVLVYTNKGGKLTPMPTFDYFDEGCKEGAEGCNFARNTGVGVRYDDAESALVVSTSFATAEDAACCPSLEREIFYKWNGKAFVVSKQGKITKREQ